MRDFRYTSYAQEVIFGPGTADDLGETFDRYGWQRALLCSTRSQRRNGHCARIEAALGERLVAVYDRALPHVPEARVVEALALADTYEIDAVIGLGGGSAVGIAKAVGFELSRRRAAQEPPVAIVAIPTTYAGSEMTPVYGVTRQEGGTSRKVTVSDARIAPRLIVYDPLLTLDLAPEMTASTGINALAHCIEALYSITKNPVSTAAALDGLRLITDALPRCYAQGDDLDARIDMLTGSYLAGTALATVAMGLHHGLCHVLGGSAGVPHGVANGIMLPHAMRFNLDSTAQYLALAAVAMGVAQRGQDADVAAEAAIQRIGTLTRELRLPRRLRDVGVSQTSLPELAQLALASSAVRNNPKPIADAAQIEAIMQAAW